VYEIRFFRTRLKIGGDKAKIIDYKGKIYPYNKTLDDWFKFVKRESRLDTTFGSDEIPINVDASELRGVIEK